MVDAFHDINPHEHVLKLRRSNALFKDEKSFILKNVDINALRTNAQDFLNVRGSTRTKILVVQMFPVLYLLFTYK